MTAGEPAHEIGRPAPELVDRQAVQSASSAVTGMTVFVASEAVFFAAFFGVYASAYAAARTWPPASLQEPSLLVPSVAVAVLLASGVTMAQALRRVHRADYPRGLVPWLFATTAGALAFAVLVAVGLFGLGFSAGQGIYESLFYVIIGLELAHAAGGVVLLGLVLVRAGAGELALRRDPVQSASIYWYFVVALGVAIYLVLYLGAVH